jgi:hypothetical protein
MDMIVFDIMPTATGTKKIVKTLPTRGVRDSGPRTQDSGLIVLGPGGLHRGKSRSKSIDLRMYRSIPDTDPRSKVSGGGLAFHGLRRDIAIAHLQRK